VPTLTTMKFYDVDNFKVEGFNQNAIFDWESGKRHETNHRWMEWFRLGYTPTHCNHYTLKHLQLLVQVKTRNAISLFFLGSAYFSDHNLVSSSGLIGPRLFRAGRHCPEQSREFSQRGLGNK
jgi:hypothetical protein